VKYPRTLALVLVLACAPADVVRAGEASSPAPLAYTVLARRMEAKVPGIGAAVELLAAEAPNSLAGTRVTTSWAWALRPDAQGDSRPRFDDLRAALAEPPPAPGAGPAQAAHELAFGKGRLHEGLAAEATAAEPYFARLAGHRAASDVCIGQLERAASLDRKGKEVPGDLRCPLTQAAYRPDPKARRGPLVCPDHATSEGLPGVLRSPWGGSGELSWEKKNAVVWATNAFLRQRSRGECASNLALLAHLVGKAHGTELPPGNAFQVMEALADAGKASRKVVPACPMDGEPCRLRVRKGRVEAGCPNHGWLPAKGP
jgi:hypothetical protein